MILEKLLEHVEREGKIDPTESADCSARYFYAARDLIAEKGLDTEEFDKKLSQYTEVEKLLAIPKEGEFIDELVLIAANETARRMLGEEREEFYTNIGRQAILKGIEESNGLFKLVGEMSVKAIFRGTAGLNKNFNRVTKMEVAKQYIGRRKIRIERSTKKKQAEKYAKIFGEEGAKEILENNCLITRGVLMAGPTAGQGKPATVYETACEAAGDMSCVYEVTWGKVKDPEKLDLKIRHEQLRRKFMQVEAQNAEYTARIRKQERQLSEQKLELAEQRLKLLEQQKQVLEKDAFLGRTARGYAHDIGNRMTIVSGYLQMVQAYEEQITPERKKEYLSTINETIDGTVEMLTDFREFVKKGKITYLPKQHGLTYLIDRSVKAFKGAARERNIEIETEYRYEGEITADHYKFPRIIENLIKNAIEAMEDKGDRITVRTYEKEGTAHIEMEDNGPGIPRHVQENIFEAGVSGKGSSGLGMSIVKTLVELHEGTIEYTTSREGTKFTIRLPATGPDPELLEP